MKKLSTALILFFYIQISFAQNYIDVFKLNLNTTPANKFDSGINSTRINEISADITLPIKINDKIAIISGATYEKIQTKVFENQPSISVQAIGLKAGISKNINQNWSASLILLPKLSSDFKEIGKNDFQLGGIAMLKYTKSEQLNYKIAIYNNSELFGPILVPMFGLYYLSSDKKWETNLLLPLQADLNYKISDKFKAGINYNGQIKTFHLNNTAAASNNTYVSRTNNELCAYLRFNFIKGLFLQSKIGYSLGRSYRIFDENDKVKFALPLYYYNDKRKQLNTDFEDGLLLQIQFIYRVEIK